MARDLSAPFVTLVLLVRAVIVVIRPGRPGRTRVVAMRTPLSRFAVGLSVVAVAVPHVLQAQSAPDTSVIRVQGAAEVRVTPDLAVVRLGVTSEARTAQEAQLAVNRTSDAILGAVRAAGVDDPQIQTVRLLLSPVYASGRPDDRPEPRIVGYQASNTLSVRLEDLELVAAVIDAALDAGANQLEGVSFGLQDDRTVRQQALRRAVEDARAKAEAMADALGLGVGRLVSVTEEPGLVGEPRLEMSRMMSLQSDLPTPVSPGEVAVSASVAIEYRLSEP